MQLSRVDIGGRSLAVRVQGAGPLVVLEVGGGAAGTDDSWNGIDELLAEFATVVTYDRAGVGGSDRVAGRPTVEDWSRDLAALLDAVDGQRPAVLVGWSLGGLIVQHFAALHPARIAGLVLLDPTPADLYAQRSRVQRLLPSAAVVSGGFAALARWGLLRRRPARAVLRRAIVSQAGPHIPPATVDRFLEAMVCAELHEAVRLESTRLAESCQQVEEALERHGLPDVPVVILSAGWRGSARMAKLQRGVDASHERTAARAPQGKRVVVPEASHYLPFEAPDAVVAAVRDVVMRSQP